MNFDITFTGETDEDDNLVAVGKITLGAHWESFHAATDYWSLHDYEESWRTALKRLADGEEVSCLITNMVDPEHANFLTTWPLYRIGNQIYVHNVLIFPEDLDEPFNPAEPWLSVGPRETVDEDGNHLSEWAISLDDVRQFLEKQDAAPAS
jgi:hypothetical protein